MGESDRVEDVDVGMENAAGEAETGEQELALDKPTSSETDDVAEEERAGPDARAENDEEEDGADPEGVMDSPELDDDRDEQPEDDGAVAATASDAGAESEPATRADAEGDGTGTDEGEAGVAPSVSAEQAEEVAADTSDDDLSAKHEDNGHTAPAKGERARRGSATGAHARIVKPGMGAGTRGRRRLVAGTDEDDYENEQAEGEAKGDATEEDSVLEKVGRFFSDIFKSLSSTVERVVLRGGTVSEWNGALMVLEVLRRERHAARSVFAKADTARALLLSNEQICHILRSAFDVQASATQVESALGSYTQDRLVNYVQLFDDFFSNPALVPTLDVSSEGVVLGDYDLVLDYYPKRDACSLPVLKCKGAVNLRKAGGFPVYGCGQPTATGFANILPKLGATVKTVLVVNLRSDAHVLVKGFPVTPKQTAAEFLRSVFVHFSDMEEACAALARDVERLTVVESGVLSVLDEDVESRKVNERDLKAKAADVETEPHVLQRVAKAASPPLRHQYARVPASEDSGLDSCALDALLQCIRKAQDTVLDGRMVPILVHCRDGLGATTAGMIASCLVLAALNPRTQSSVETPEEKPVKKRADADSDALERPPDLHHRAEYACVRDLIVILGPVAREAKEKVDHAVNVCSGWMNIRHGIYVCKGEAEAADARGAIEDGWLWYRRGVSLLKQYLSLITFQTYLLESAPAFLQTYDEWLNDHPTIVRAFKNLFLV